LHFEVQIYTKHKKTEYEIKTKVLLSLKSEFI